MGDAGVIGEQPALFSCARRELRLTTAGCVRLWKSANAGSAPEPWEGRAACRHCSTGAVNAGKAMAAAAAQVEALGSVCPRCLNPTLRLVGGRFCISCYNRHAEAVKGRNAKGSRPQLCSRLHTERLAIVDGDTIRVLQREMVTGPAEAMILAAREIGRPVAFGWSRSGG